METQTKNSADSVLNKQIIDQLINAWAAQNKGVTSFFNKYEEDVYLKEVAPGRNRAVYLLGHLIAVNDGMLPLMGIRERLFPHLEKPFLAADKSVNEIPSVSELKKYWETLNTTLTERFNKMNPADWLGRHTAVSEEDFALDPKRNKLNILISRTNHQSYHLGQLNLLIN